MAQASSLRQAWKYSSGDHLLHVLPLHHIHGILNALLVPLLAGSSVEFLFPFDAEAVWQRLAQPFQNHGSKKVTLFTAVPTMYHRLLSSFERLPPSLQAVAKTAISPANMRLNMSGSAALPSATQEKWSKLSNGNILLERYGMTEVGMALSCGLEHHDRPDGSVGWPLPMVQVRLVDPDTNQVLTADEAQGEIQLRGPTIFKDYWQNPASTTASFVEENGQRWFKTGDIASRTIVDHQIARGPAYFIQGRRSVDIINTGGEKVSALEVERELLLL